MPDGVAVLEEGAAVLEEGVAEVEERAAETEEGAAEAEEGGAVTFTLSLVQLPDQKCLPDPRSCEGSQVVDPAKMAVELLVGGQL